MARKTRKKGQPAPSLKDLRSRPSYWLYLINIRCNTPEDWGTDEVYISINGMMRWGIVSMSEGDNQSLEVTVEPVRFRTSVWIEVWDNDSGIWDSDDKLGHVDIKPDESTLDQEQVAQFRGDEASYDVTYVVSKEGP